MKLSLAVALPCLPEIGQVPQPNSTLGAMRHWEILIRLLRASRYYQSFRLRILIQLGKYPNFLGIFWLNLTDAEWVLSLVAVGMERACP